MSLVRTWRAALLRASGAIALVPVALLLAVALAASLTGVGRIGSIGQLVAGPGLPPASAAEARSGAGTLGAVPAVPAPAEGQAVGTARALRGDGAATGDGGSRGSDRGARRRSGRGRERPPSARRPGGRRPPSRSPAPSGPGGGGGGGGSADEPLPGPPRQTGLIRRIGREVDRIVRPLPAVGPPVADAVNTVVQLLDPPPSGAAAAPTPRDPLKPAG